METTSPVMSGKGLDGLRLPSIDLPLAINDLFEQGVEVMPTVYLLFPDGDKQVSLDIFSIDIARVDQGEDSGCQFLGSETFLITH